jgi:hypothetical protein
MSLRKSDRSPTPDSTDKSRRSFFWKFGAGVSGALAAPAVVATPRVGDDADLSLQVALLEEEKALRKLHQTFEQAIDNGRYEDVVGLFADDAQVVFNGGVFANRGRGVSRLFRDRFRPTKTGKRIEPAPGFELDAEQLQDRVQVSHDRLSATAVFPYSIQVGVPIESETSLVHMARLQGEGVQTWWEGGVYNLTYRKASVDDHWTISRLEYKTLASADYRPGRSYAKPIAVPRISKRYPEDRHGPDALIG